MNICNLSLTNNYKKDLAFYSPVLKMMDLKSSTTATGWVYIQQSEKVFLFREMKFLVGLIWLIIHYMFLIGLSCSASFFIRIALKKRDKQHFFILESGIAFIKIL